MFYDESLRVRPHVPLLMEHLGGGLTTSRFGAELRGQPQLSALSVDK